MRLLGYCENVCENVRITQIIVVEDHNVGQRSKFFGDAAMCHTEDHHFFGMYDPIEGIVHFAGI
jgi:hypothetical protein